MLIYIAPSVSDMIIGLVNTDLVFKISDIELQIVIGTLRRTVSRKTP